MDILVKVSGDLEGSDKFYDWLASINNPEDKLFILCGGGSLITKVLEKQNIPFKFGPAGREIASSEGKILAMRILKEQGFLVWKRLKERGIEASVFAPVEEIGNKICHMNGDNYALALCLNFDKTYFVTLKGRVKSFPKEFERIEVVYL